LFHGTEMTRDIKTAALTFMRISRPHATSHQAAKQGDS
jgi:hypothetical protein